jgi:pyruvate formate lyase activating enzyme
MPEAQLAVGGLVPFTTIDFPGRLAAVVFCQGCPWRCAYCHNPHLLPRGAGVLPWPEVLRWLNTRRGLLDGVVFSGGEPLLQRGLPDAIAGVRALGFATALHTAGIYPERLAEVLPLLDWVGFDVKAPFAEYAPIVGCDGGGAARTALAMLLASGVAHEIRCTVPPELGHDALDRLCAELATLGAAPPTLQTCRPPTPSTENPA